MKGKFVAGGTGVIHELIQDTKKGQLHWRPLWGCFATAHPETDTLFQHFCVVGSNEIRYQVNKQGHWKRFLVEDETPELRAQLLEAIILGGLETT